MFLIYKIPLKSIIKMRKKDKMNLVKRLLKMPLWKIMKPFMWGM